MGPLLLRTRNATLPLAEQQRHHSWGPIPDQTGLKHVKKQTTWKTELQLLVPHLLFHPFPSFPLSF